MSDRRRGTGTGGRSRGRRLRTAAAAVVLLLLVVPVGGAVQTDVDPGFNLLSVEQDVEIGREASRQLEDRYPVIEDRTVAGFVSRLGERLAGHAPGADYPYDFEVLNVSDVNAFALPGGFVYVNRGLVELAGGEAELAGVMAHEIAHVALRHGTSQASKAYLANAGFGILGALLGEGTTTDIVEVAGGFGLNALFLKFSREDEEEADVVGAQIMARSGYDPMEMVEMFERMRRHSGGGGGSVPTFFSSHPPYDERTARVEREARMLDVGGQSPVGGFSRAKGRLRNMPDAPSMEELATD